MKQLLLIRHAKSSWSNPGVSDHERPLNKRGKRNLPLMAEHIQQQGYVVERLISSNAVRAATTARALAPALLQRPVKAAEQALELEHRLYQFDWQPLWHFLQQQPDTVRKMALVGHNPALEELLQRLCDESHSLPTCALAVLQLNLNHWQALHPGCAELLYRTSPKALAP
ncbi:histidine phosphatase family protein [Motiliproteus coralliicola]|uniref:Histidine phosphatase family protein n=1 Tax=Motiliproteus coralliicola TaxID=2283196 RepID=A0A369WLZ1_9GAMM|nr:histidine phosphatase family protein [Motiliproteus coralliicola]RDE22481.1 histidine phosphatase family protein [Motiliproteus coralliicola]